SQFVEPVVGCHVRNRDLPAGSVPQRPAGALEALREQAALRSETADLVKRVSKSAFAEAYHPAELGDRERRPGMGAKVGLDSFDGGRPRGSGARARRGAMAAGFRHGAVNLCLPGGSEHRRNSGNRVSELTGGTANSCQPGCRAARVTAV